MQEERNNASRLAFAALAEAADMSPEEAVNGALAYIQENEFSVPALALIRVLLHAYNPSQPLSVDDLVALNPSQQVQAWTVLALRVAGNEPHLLAKDPAVFDALVETHWHVAE